MSTAPALYAKKYDQRGMQCQTELPDEMLKELLEYICIKPFSSQSINLAASSVIVSSLSENKTRTMRVKKLDRGGLPEYEGGPH